MKVEPEENSISENVVDAGAAAAAQISEDDVKDSFAEIHARYEAGEELTDEDVDTIADAAVSYIRNVIGFFGEKHISIDEYDGDDGELILDVSGGDLAILIGRHGRTLDAVQMLVNSYMSNLIHFYYPIVVDIEGYKSRRKQKLVSLAESAAERAIKNEGQVRMSPMNAYERRIVHLSLLENEHVTTHSEGEDPQRCVVVTFVR